MSVITRDKDTELMKKIARYKLNKITKELTSTTVQITSSGICRKKEKLQTSKFVCLVISNWRFMKSFQPTPLRLKLVDLMISRTEKVKINTLVKHLYKY